MNQTLQFLLNLIPLDNPMSLGIIIMVLLWLTFLIWKGLRINKKIYTHFERINSRITYNPTVEPFIENLKQTYNKLRRSTENEMNLPSFIESYMSEYAYDGIAVVKELKRVQTYSSMMILIGVLGTFVGLVFALAEINMEQIDDSIKNVLGGVHTAFYTSIMGIGFSMFMSYRLKKENAEQLLVQVMLKMENHLIVQDHRTTDQKIVTALQDVKSAILEMKQSFVDVQDFSESFETATENLDQFNESFSHSVGRLENVFGNMEQHSERFNHRMETLHEDLDELFSYLDNQTVIHSTMVTSMQESSKRLNELMENQTVVLKDYHEMMVKIADSTLGLKDELKDYLGTYTEKLHDSYEAMCEFYEEHKENQQKLVASVTTIENRNREYIVSVDEATKTMRNILENGSFDHLADLTGHLSTNIQGMSSMFGQLNHHFQQAEQEKNNYVQFYSNMRQFLEDLSIQNSKAQSQFDNSVKIIQSFDSKSTALTEEVILLSKEMNSSFEKHYGQFREQAEVLQQMLNEYIHQTSENLDKVVSKMDSNLGRGVSQSLSEFKNYVQTTNRVIEQQFVAMVEQSSTHLQTNAFSTQALHDSIQRLSDNIELMRNQIDIRERGLTS